MGDDALDGALVFVGGDGAGDAAVGELPEEFGDACVGRGEVVEVVVVVLAEVGAHGLDHACRARFFGECTLEEFGDAVADHVAVGGYGVGGESELCEGVVGGVGEVFYGVYECAVKVKDDK